MQVVNNWFPEVEQQLHQAANFFGSKVEKTYDAISDDKAKPIDYIAKPLKAAGKLILNSLEIAALAINCLYNNIMAQSSSTKSDKKFYEKALNSKILELNVKDQQLESNVNRFIELIHLLAKGKKFTLLEEKAYNLKDKFMHKAGPVMGTLYKWMS